TKQRLKKQLLTAREYTRSLLTDLSTPEQWTQQVHPEANHPLWFAGHMATADNFFLSTLAPERVVKRPEFDHAFGTGSRPTSNPADYPPPDEVLEVMDERRRTLLEVLEGMEEPDFEKPLPKGAPDFLPDFGSVFEMAIWHEGLHSGQLSVARRSMGLKPCAETKGIKPCAEQRRSDDSPAR
ncbi:MAG: DinB family protein, partial [Planctomycetia bacterium]|nr:DinB family protein [Planctomycetia bacterium]